MNSGCFSTTALKTKFSFSLKTCIVLLIIQMQCTPASWYLKGCPVFKPALWKSKGHSPLVTWEVSTELHLFNEGVSGQHTEAINLPFLQTSTKGQRKKTKYRILLAIFLLLMYSKILGWGCNPKLLVTNVSLICYNTNYRKKTFKAVQTLKRKKRNDKKL